MQIGMIGLGRMGGNIARRLMQHGHEAVVYDRDAKAVAALSKDGASGVAGLDKLVKQLRPPRAVWVMLPAGEITEATIVELGNCSKRATSCSTAATRSGRTISAARKC